MSHAFSFKLILLALIAIIALEWLAKRLRLPPAVALLLGGVALAFIPGLPSVEIDPELILLVFLPPLLMDGAYYIDLDEFKCHLAGILLLAIGAVTFTTLAVGYATHWLLPGLPWGACFALGAIVSPPDAIAAKAVLERVSLPRPMMALLEGESMLNDATGLVLYRFAVVAALTGAFSAAGVLGEFFLLCAGGIVSGALMGWAVMRLIQRLSDTYLVIVTTCLPAWLCYVVAEAVGASGVMATVTYGMMLGWHQHDLVSATVRVRGGSFWQVIVFLFESLVFILVGFSLRGVVSRIGSNYQSADDFAIAITFIVGAVLLSRFLWVFGVDSLQLLWKRLRRKDKHRFDWRGSTIKSWAGMRGVVTLAAALALPAAFPGRDLILAAAFAVIVVTVIGQGMTIGPLIRLLNVGRGNHRYPRSLTEPECWARLEAAQFAAVRQRAYDVDGALRHPRLLEQYGYRASVADQHKARPELPHDIRTAHFDIVLAAVAAGRRELLALHRAGRVEDDLLHMLEHDLDLQEMCAIHGRGQ